MKWKPIAKKIKFVYIDGKYYKWPKWWEFWKWSWSIKLWWEFRAPVKLP